MPICAECGLSSTSDAVFCARCGTALSASDQVERRRLVTILFCDLVGSTKLGERLDPEILRGVQSRYFAATSTALRRHGGQVEKFIGDAVMCVFGLPVANEDDAVRACRAACDLLAALDELNRELIAELGVHLEVRIGVNTGEVVAGDPTRGQALVTGDAVNTAARLEQAAGTGEILLGALTMRLAEGATTVEPRPPISAKGKAEPVAAYRLVSVDSAGHARVAGRPGEMIGRRAELDGLRMAFAECASGPRARLLLVTGEAGIGKSRLVGEFADAVALEGRVLLGRCVPYGEGITYWPLREIVESLLAGDDRELVALLASDSQPGWVASRVLRLVGRSDGELTRADAFEAVARLLAALAAREPILAIVEDLHWAEPTLLDLLRFLPERLDHVPVLLVGTSRSELLEQRPDLEAHALRLAPLDSAAAELLLEGDGTLGAGQRSRLLAAAGGNPLFLHQLRAAAEQGDPSGLPPDLHALLGARLDVLGDAERGVLEAAAVVGREFWPAAVAALLDPDQAHALTAQLVILTRGEFIAPGRPDARRLDGAPDGLSGLFGSEGRFSFRHVLLQDVAYRSMPKARVIDLHERFAGFLEAEGGDPERGRPLIAWHLEQASRLRAQLRPGRAASAVARRAAALLEEEARQALAQDEPGAAVNLLSRATALAPELTSSRLALEAARTRSGVQPERGAAAAGGIQLAPGETLGGYEIESLAGQGGMGVVYRARDPRLHRTVAVKVITPALASEPGFRERFQRESRIAAQIEHPNVIPVYRAGEDGGRLFIAMRYVDGSDLATVLAGEGRLEVVRTVALLGQVARALDAAHARGLVHRDVKPGNVLIDEGAAGERAYLTDFGLSLEHDAPSELTRTGQWVGTPAYAAPEQIRAARVDARTDVYALGAVFFHCLTGTLPFAGRSEFEMLAAHLGESPPRPSESVPGARAFDAVVARAMAKEPSDRYTSAGDLGRALVAASRGERSPGNERSVATGAAAPGDAGARVAPRRRLRLRRAGIAAVMAAVALAVVAVTLTLALRSSDAPPAESQGETVPATGNPAGRLAGAAIELRQPPERTAVVGGYVWALSKDPGRLARLDPESGVVEYFPAPIDLGGGLFPDIAGGVGSLWLSQANASVGGVDRIDTQTVEAVERIRLPSASALFVTEDAVWVTTTRAQGSGSRRGTLARIETARNRLWGSPVPISRDPADVVAGLGAVWVADRASDSVVRVDPATLRIRARVPVGRGPGILAVTERAVWVANLEDRTLSQIDPAANEAVGAPLALGKEIEDLLAAGGSLWVAAADGTVTRIDPATEAVVGEPIAVGRPPLTLAWDRNRLWVASASDQTLQAIEPGV